MRKHWHDEMLCGYWYKYISREMIQLVCQKLRGVVNKSVTLESVQSITRLVWPIDGVSINDLKCLVLFPSIPKRDIIEKSVFINVLFIDVE